MEFGMFPNLHHSHLFYRAKHWLRDGGFNFLIQSTSMHILFMGSVFLMMVLCFVGYYVLAKKAEVTTASKLSSVVDHKKDGTSDPGRDLRFRFPLTTRMEKK